MDWLISWLWEFLYSIQKSVCSICDFIRDIFNMLGGLETVNIDGKQSDMLTYFIEGGTVRTIFLAVVLIAVITVTIFTLVAIVRSEYAHGENKKGKGIILGNAGKSLVIFLLIPFVLIAGITLTNVTMKSLNAAMNPYMHEEGGGMSIGGQILITAGANAYMGEELKSEVEKAFISGTKDYRDIEVVKQYYNLSELDFFVGIIGSVVILVMFAMCAIAFIQRLFDIVLLYIISPLSTSTIPLDDGARFKLWREMMVSKVLSGYGIILTMNLFFIIMPKLTSIEFFDDSFQNGVVRILFIIGGAFAVTKANLVISQLTGASAGTAESQQMIANMRTGMNITKGLATTAITAAGTVLGGTKFVRGKKYGGLMGGITDTFKGSGSGKSPLSSAAKSINSSGAVGKGIGGASTIKNIAAAPVKLAALPFKMVKDIASGGLVGAGKNFMPRLKALVGKEDATSSAIKTAKGVMTIDSIENDLNISEGGSGNDTDNT